MREAECIGTLVDHGEEPAVGEGRRAVGEARELERRARRRADLTGELLESLREVLELCGVEVAQVHRQHHLPGDHVGRVGRHTETTDRRHLPPGLSANRIVHRHGELRGGEHRVLPLVHRRRAGVICKPGDRHLEPSQPDDALDDTDLATGLLQQPTLLDVQLEVAGQVAARPLCFLQARHITTDDADALAHRLARSRDLVEIRVGEHADQNLAADRAPLLVLPHHHVERVGQRHALLGQRAGHFDRGERSNRTIEVAAVGDGVHV